MLGKYGRGEPWRQGQTTVSQLASGLSPPAAIFRGPFAVILPLVQLSTLVQLPEPSLQSLLHGGWVLTACSSSFGKQQLCPRPKHSQGLPSQASCAAFSICGGTGVTFFSFSFSSLIQEELWGDSAYGHGTCSPGASSIVRAVSSGFKNIQASKASPIVTNTTEKIMECTGTP